MYLLKYYRTSYDTYYRVYPFQDEEAYNYGYDKVEVLDGAEWETTFYKNALDLVRYKKSYGVSLWEITEEDMNGILTMRELIL